MDRGLEREAIKWRSDDANNRKPVCKKVREKKRKEMDRSSSYEGKGRGGNGNLLMTACLSLRVRPC